MKKPSEYDATQAKSFGEFESLEPGGYVCRILKAESTKSKNGKEMLVLNFDIADGEHKGFYQRKLERDSENDKKASWKGVYRQLTEGDSISYFKGLITAIEESNTGYHWDWEESSLVGKIFGGIFGLEEWAYNGKTGFVAKIQFICSIATIKKGVKIPKDKLLTKKSNGVKDDDFVLMADDDSFPF